MIWLNPWAWFGLAAIAAPIFIHLLGRGHARVVRFPSLRFLSVSRLLPTRRTRLHDLVLLAVRVGILIAAAAALAQPLLLTGDRAATRNRAIARVIVVDTSFSMKRLGSSGAPAVALARAAAARLADSSAASVVVETAAPAAVIRGAVDWLAARPERTELVILSDFQIGVIDSGTLMSVPPSTGIRLARIGVAPDSAPLLTRSAAGSVDVVARTTLTPLATTVEWTRQPTPRTPTTTVLAGDAERAAVDAAIRAAATRPAPLPLDSTHAVAIVLPRAGQRDALLRGATLPDAGWMFDVILRVQHDPVLAAAARGVSMAPPADPRGAGTAGTVGTAVTAGASGASGAPTAAVAVLRNRPGAPVLLAAQDRANGEPRLLLFSRADAGSLMSPALIAAVDRARSLAPPVAELDPATRADSLLRRADWPPAADAPRRPASADDASDGRWVWVVVLLLLLLESWLRRAPAPIATLSSASLAHDRVA